jgi:peptide chain release factor 3
VHLAGVSGSRVMARADGTLLALFETPGWLARLETEHPEWTLEPLIAGDQPGGV